MNVKKSSKVITSLALVITIIFSFFYCYSFGTDFTVSAASDISNGYYRIIHIESGKYVDVKDESTDNGATLQIWEYAEGNQNQIFYIENKCNGKYAIYANHSQKAIEVRDSSKEDRATVAQWDYVKKTCQQWNIILNFDGSYSFVNVNSGKYLNVEGNETKNGTRLIQYYSDGTTAEKFKLVKMTSSDIIDAEWKTSADALTYEYFTISSTNNVCTSEFGYIKNGRWYYPSTSKNSLYSVTYIDKDKIIDMVTDSAKKDTLSTALSNYAKDEAYGKIIDKIAEYIPGISEVNTYILKPLCLMYKDGKNTEWNNFIDAANKAMKNGKGIVITTKLKETPCYTYGALNNCSGAFGAYYTYRDTYSFEYKEWSENGVSEIQNNGKWKYTFK